MSRVTEKTRRLVLERAGNACEIRVTDECRAAAGTLLGPSGYSIHHRRPRGMGGTNLGWINDPHNLLALCGDGTQGCHGWIESHRRMAYTNGWLLPSFAHPEAYALLLHDGRTVRLLPDATYDEVFGKAATP